MVLANGTRSVFTNETDPFLFKVKGLSCLALVYTVSRTQASRRYALQCLHRHAVLHSCNG